jgi:biopolymer transport protein ExbD
VKVTKPAIVPEPPFDLTPMIDVVLLLIIFFTLTSQFARSEARPMDLPREPGQAVVSTAKASLLIDVERDGSLFLLGSKGTIEDVERSILSARNRNQTLSVEVRADRAAPAAALNQIARALAKGGVTEWSLATAAGGGSGGGGAK